MAPVFLYRAYGKMSKRSREMKLITLPSYFPFVKIFRKPPKCPIRASGTGDKATNGEA